VALGTIADYYPNIPFPTPKVGKWEVRDNWVIDIRGIPSQRNGYCYGKQIMWVDKVSANALWKDMYDANMKPLEDRPAGEYRLHVPNESMQYETGNFWQATYDIQTDHFTSARTADASGRWNVANEDCKNAGGINYYDNIKGYSTVAGLAQVMR
jgi:hypothetical protein